MNEYCERCGEKLNPKTLVELELSQETGLFTNPGQIPREESQGCFVFGINCAKAVLKNGGDLVRLTSKTKRYW